MNLKFKNEDVKIILPPLLKYLLELKIKFQLKILYYKIFYTFTLHLNILINNYNSVTLNTFI